jgi:putative hydrolase of the HAD superfamily
MARPRIIFFDAGGTLLDPHPSVGHVYAEIAGDHGLALDAAAVQRAFARAFPECIARALDERGWILGFSPESGWHFWREVLHATFEDLEVREGPLEEIWNQIYDDFSHAHRYALVDGARETLGALRESGHRLGLISNWDHRLRGILRGLDLGTALDPVVISCEVGAEKPDAAIFHHALSAAGVEADEALMVGDTAIPDGDGAKAVGMHAVLIRRSAGGAKDHATLPDLRALPAWIDTEFGQ